MGGSAALLGPAILEARLSHSRAGYSGPQRAAETAVARRGYRAGLVRLQPGRFFQNMPRLRLEARRALQQADYSFYQRLRPGEVNEQYLWDQRLLPLLGYLTADQAVKVREALSLAYDAHSGQRRKSGEPFITHPVEVTRILAELKMDFECLVAGLLHDTVEDCSDVVGLDEIEFHFGRNVRRIVEGETKFCKLPSYLSSQGNGGSGSDGEAAAGRDGAGGLLALRGLPLPRRPGGGGEAPNGASAGSLNGSGSEMDWGATGPKGAAAGISGSLSSAAASSSSSSSSMECPDLLEGEGAQVAGAWGAAGGGEEEAVPPPKPSTFTTSEEGRQPLLDLVLSTPGNDKPSRAQDIQFLFLAMTEEWRIIVVKLADRLHNMRTMGSMPQLKARKIAAETLEVFGPLARLLGLYSIKEELEELAFKYAYPAAYDMMRREVKKLWDAQCPVVEAACAELLDRLAHDAYLRERMQGVRVTATRKALYSSWKKLFDAGKSAKDLRDIAQLLVVVDPSTPGGAASLDYCGEKQLCYHVMGLVHSFWAPIPGSMKDYIATPKPNNYQSLHTTVVPTGIQLDQVSQDGKPATMFPIEVQIRTEAMSRVAELGIAVDTWAPPPSSGAGAGTSSNGAAKQQQQQQQQLSWGGGAAAARNGSNGAAPAARPPQPPGNGGQPQRSSSWVGSLLQWAQQPNSSDEDEPPPPQQPQQQQQQQQQQQAGSGRGVGGLNGSAAAAAPAGEQRRRQGQGLPAGLQRLDPATMTRRINWLNSIRQWQEEFVGTLTAHEFIQCVTDDILGQGVFVFTPGGQIIRLPKGATVVDFAYHIHTQIGNTMAAARVNSKLVQPGYELQNADVVEVVPYGGPVNGNILRKHQEWYRLARTKTARHKIMRFLRENAALAASKGIKLMAPLELGEASAAGGAAQSLLSQSMWLVIQCEDRQGILADVAQVISEHQFNIKSYSGSSDLDDASGVLNFALEGDAAHLGAMCKCLDSTPGVRQRAVGCELPEAVVPLKPRI